MTVFQIKLSIKVRVLFSGYPDVMNFFKKRLSHNMESEFVVVLHMKEHLDANKECTETLLHK